MHPFDPNDDIVDGLGPRLERKRLDPPGAPETLVTHLGMFLGWALRRNLVVDDLERQLNDPMTRDLRQASGRDVIMRLGGNLRLSLLDEKLKPFAARYCGTSGRFMLDYVQEMRCDIMARQPYTICNVQDSAENQSRVLRLLDERFSGWEIYPPSADRLYDNHNGSADHLYALNSVTHLGLLAAARQISIRGDFYSFVVFIDRHNLIRISETFVSGGRHRTIASLSNTDSLDFYIGEKLAAGEFVATAVVSPARVNASSHERQSAIVAHVRHRNGDAYIARGPYDVIVGHRPCFHSVWVTLAAGVEHRQR